MHCTSSPYGVGTVRAIARWYGSSGLQVGTLKDPGFLSGEEALEKYNKPLALSVGPEEREAGDAVKLYRKLMAGWPDGSVDIVAVGPLRNLGNLLRSGPDEFSPLSGRELAAAKVRRLTMMAGDFSEGCDRAEWNVDCLLYTSGKGAGHLSERRLGHQRKIPGIQCGVGSVSYTHLRCWAFKIRPIFPSISKKIWG